MMSKRTRQYIGILFAIVAYYIVHEGAHLLVKAIFYYVTVIMLVLDPIYLCLLSGAFGGGDLNGILYLMPQAWVWTIFAFILLFNIWILLKKVNPIYTASFKEK